MPVYKATALVLRRIPLGEKDKIVTLFTREWGKVRAVAKGARKTTSKLAGGTEPLMLIRALLSEGHSLDVVSQCEVRESFPLVRGEYERYLRATYACELLDRLTEERDPSGEAFDLLLSTLYILQRAVQPDAALHAFELQLLAISGYEPHLDACIRCERSWNDARVQPVAYAPLRGGALCGPCADSIEGEPLACSDAMLAALRRLAVCDEARELAQMELPSPVLGGINAILRAHLRVRLERQIKSTEFLDALRLEESS